ncbi:hypothetical protein [Methylacidimicrobium sp. AP8]|uniref:hypothetical protein n=1 Tax=Methylacidimicrobium sp. AP8 TaxID=2730359 RepID=UPI0019249182|nr:hypothetical protein [Methylacidimicrobium sp. AP8]
MVSAKRYYTLSLAGPAAPGQESRPYVRYQAEWRLVNKGSGSSFEIENDELAYLPYLEYRAWVDGVPLPVQKIGNRYFFRIYLRRRQTATVQVSSLQRVLPIDPARKIDEFEDLIEWRGWMPPIEDYWVVVDLGGIYTAYRQQVPAFGLGGNGPAPGLSFPQFLANRIVQISPGGYQQGAGNKIWWHEQNVWKPQEYFTLRVRWQAWYR